MGLTMRAANIRIGYLLGACFCAGIFLFLLSAAVAIFQMNAVQARLDRIVKEDNLKTQDVHKLVLSVVSASENIRTLPLLQDEKLLTEQNRKIEHANAEYAAAWKSINALPLSANERAVLGDVTSARDNVNQVNAEIVKLALDSRVTEATDLILNKAGAATSILIGKLASLQDTGTQEGYFAASSARKFATRIIVILSIISLVAGLIVSWLVTRAVTQPLLRAVEFAGEVAQGDLRQSISVVGKSETGDVLRAMQKMNGNLVRVVTDVRQVSRNLSAVAEEVNNGAIELSSRTESTASSLEQTAASMEELSATVNQNAEHASQAAKLASSASETAGRGGAAFNEVVANMNAIDQSSKRIVDIITVMDGIAFQTNILALNAAVEAARAGEQGRGFAVVASEVRALAQRSATAAKEIKTLIADSVARIEVGAKVVNGAGKTMDEILSINREVNRIVHDIAQASAEQSDGIGQIKRAIEQMDDATQQNGALVGALATATNAMQSELRQLTDGVDFFRIQESSPNDSSLLDSKPHKRAINRPLAPAISKNIPERKSSLPGLMESSSDWRSF
jgi:methyl-accepting chemotaxis protein